jgi:hypothetical protein
MLPNVVKLRNYVRSLKDSADFKANNKFIMYKLGIGSFSIASILLHPPIAR